MNPATEAQTTINDPQLAPFINGTTFKRYCASTGFTFDSSDISVIDANDGTGNLVFNLQKTGSKDDAVWVYTTAKTNTYVPCIVHRYQDAQGVIKVDFTAMLTNVLYVTASNQVQPKKDCNNMSFSQCISCEEVIIQSDWRTFMGCMLFNMDSELFCLAWCALACTRSTMYIPSGGGQELSQQTFNDIFDGWYTDYYYDETTSTLIAN